MNSSLAFISGATSGLGKELAYRLAKEKVPLFLTARKEEELLLLQEELSSLTQVQICPADLTLPSDMKNLLEQISLHTPDLVFHAAGLGLYGNCLSFPLDKQRTMIQVNIDAAFQITYTAAKALRKIGKKGTIVQIGSMAAHFLYPRFALYAASKRCIEDLCLSLDEELRCFGIRVLVAVPGRFVSPFLQKSYRSIAENSWSMIPLEKVATLILRQVEKQKKRKVIDFRYKILYAVSLLIPKRLLARYL